MKRIVTGIVVVMMTVVGCGTVKKGYNKVVSKDVTLEDQQAMADQYHGRNAWTRTTFEDLTERDAAPGTEKKKVIQPDTKVEIIEVNAIYNGSVTVVDAKRKRVKQALDLEEPLNPEKIDARLRELMWFDDPTIRQVNYIRKWGKDCARSVIAHEVYVGMPAEAALESWGVPDDKLVEEIAGQEQETWKYREGTRTRYVYIADGTVFKYEE